MENWFKFPISACRDSSTRSCCAFATGGQFGGHGNATGMWWEHHGLGAAQGRVAFSQEDADVRGCDSRWALGVKFVLTQSIWNCLVWRGGKLWHVEVFKMPIWWLSWLVGFLTWCVVFSPFAFVALWERSRPLRSPHLEIVACASRTCEPSSPSSKWASCHRQRVAAAAFEIETMSAQLSSHLRWEQTCSKAVELEMVVLHCVTGLDFPGAHSCREGRGCSTTQTTADTKKCRTQPLKCYKGQFLSCVLSFQVRRMVGALVAVGQGKLAPHHIKELLEMKDARAFPPFAMAPSSGLFLKSVEYNEAGKGMAGSDFTSVGVRPHTERNWSPHSPPFCAIYSSCCGKWVLVFSW